MPAPKRTPLLAAQDRVHDYSPRVLSDLDLLTALLGACGSSPPRPAAQQLLDAVPLTELAWSSPDALVQHTGIGPARAAAIAAAFELGRRGAWSPPQRGERCLDPNRVYELMRYAAHAERECFYVILLDVRGRLLKSLQVAEGSLSQCPVCPRDTLRPAVREDAHGVVFVHNHPSGYPTPSQADHELTARIRTASEVVGVTARDHIIVAASGFYSYVQSGRW